MPTSSPDPAPLAGLDLGGTVVGPVLRTTGKSIVRAGRHDGRPVAVKVLTSTDAFWRATFAREIAVYRTLAASPAPVRTPALVHTDDARVLVVERLPGRVLAEDRHPEVTEPVGPALDALAAFAGWRPPPGALVAVVDYAGRIDRSHRDGVLDDRAHTALHALLAELGPPDAVAHGDPLPSNLLVDGDACSLVDFEFTGRFLPGFDLAMLHTLLGASPQVRERIRGLVADAGIERPFLLNRAIVLARELRMHRTAPDRALLTRLAAEWDELTATLTA